MAEETKSGGGSALGFALPFFGIILAIWFFGGAGKGGGIFGNASTSPFRFGSLASSSQPTSTPERRSSYYDFRGRTESISSPAPRKIERDIQASKQELEKIKKDAAEAKLWGIISPYKGKVRLGRASAGQTDADKEYLTIAHSARDEEIISVSGWTLESAITGKRATIPHGVRLVRNNSVNHAVPITLERNTSAYVVTGESPLGVSFHENKCIGYLSEFQEFTPPLRSSCPYPQQEMKSLGTIALDDDTCYEAVSHVSSCRLAPDDVLDRHLSSACRDFLEDDLTYSGCVRRHQYDPFFYDGSWRIYLERENDLWREEREIVRLLDNEGKTVSVLEY